MTRTWGWLAAVVDIVLIVAFALIGRSSHAEASSLTGLWTTAYPFLAGWLVGYLVVRGWRRPLRVWPTGVVVWVATVAIGMLLRVLTGQGDVAGDPLPLSFVIVATISLAVFLLGWRLLVGLVLRTGRRGRGRA
ncbi:MULTISPECIES: DUF3054 domain-containing protein [unclassified Curtobacterium]|uniref:DUF3054 domain-containing protein n=1 Tax=unclassified Curtobacterium TaxID=257496 RepID=UPI001AE7F46D|nr:MULTISPECIES: DUF3054 domain-containing protein [unclassified Curtobacterium]MBP1300929.1 hypothetical protein [Curtobacterium sp. 1310]MCM3520787.1 DUF3054 domain-containing protein [Curtobacterium sp. P97]MDB6426403.1 DUF3054 domain-containing protein [Curtobacterium sp. 20TX0008]